MCSPIYRIVFAKGDVISVHQESQPPAILLHWSVPWTIHRILSINFLSVSEAAAQEQSPPWTKPSTLAVFCNLKVEQQTFLRT